MPVGQVVSGLFHLLATMDILVNACSDFYGHRVINRLSIYSIQDLCLILSLIVFVILFFGEQILQSGSLMSLLLANSRTFLIISVYLILTIVLQTLIIHRMNTLSDVNDPSNAYFWSDDHITVVVYFVQRLFSAAYYFSLRDSVTQLCNTNNMKQTNNKQEKLHSDSQQQQA